MRVAFYAPLKPPDHPIPSGDRRVARLLLRAIRDSGSRVAIASRMRAYDQFGDAAVQTRLRRRAESIATRYIERHKADPPDLWFTYHLYHKAPDWIGPTVCDAYGIPYVVAEASIAPKQVDGAWRTGHVAATAAVRRADRVIVLNPNDRECLEPLVRHRDVLAPLPPFIETASARDAVKRRRDCRARIAKRHGIDAGDIWIAVTAMMRPGDKLDSYRVLGRVVAGLTDLPLRWLVAGDGSARDAVEQALGSRNVWYLGSLDRLGVDELHGASDLAVWPAIREAFGMALLEAQAAGLPVIAGASPGVAQIVADGNTGILTPPSDAAAMANAVRALASDAPRRKSMGRAAMGKAMTHHDIAAAAIRIGRVLEEAKASAE